MSELEQVRLMAERLLAIHLDEGWSFGFDHAKRRAGLCNFGQRRISLSRYLAARCDDATNEQTVLHEIAHALTGPDAGHGPAWRALAARIGYTGGRTLPGEGVDDLAPWVGRCPHGHRSYRYRRPPRLTSCGRCSRRFDDRYLITWSRRETGTRAGF